MNTTLTIVGICAGLYFAFVGAYLSVLMGRVLKQNGRVLDKIDQTTKMLAEKMDEGFKLIARLIVEENETTRKQILEVLKR
ncbi:MAG: hypothetical protein QME68_05975 [Elusimicrobiota bacterium]|nr:hypothetical protein [Elusimicrobiota bacterium]